MPVERHQRVLSGLHTHAHMHSRRAGHMCGHKHMWTHAYVKPDRNHFMEDAQFSFQRFHGGAAQCGRGCSHHGRQVAETVLTEPEVGLTSKVTYFLSQAPLPKGPTASPKSITIWAIRIQNLSLKKHLKIAYNIF